MEQKPGWTYQYIETLGMQIAVNDKTGIMYTEDRIMYTVEEANLLRSINFQLPLQVHLLKKTFGGTLLCIN